MALVRRDTTLDGKKECAVSEIIGSIMLVSIVVVAVAIVGVVLWSQPPPEKIPVLSAGIANQSCKVTVSHTGGDTLENATFSIYVDGNDQTANFNKGGTPGTWTSWGIGETLVYDPTPCTPSQIPRTVQIIYTGGNGALILSSAYFENIPSGGLPVTTSTTTTTTPVPPGPVTASFTGSPTSGNKPLAVQFTDASTGPVTSWSWTFGDGGTSIAQSPLYVYLNAGTFTVSLMVSNGTGSDTLTRPNYITVSTPAPTVTSIMPNTGIRGNSISITNLAGSNFVSGATVKLKRTGDPDIDATGVTVVSSTQITCTFPIPSGATTGLWNVVVTNPDTQSGTLTNGFMVMYPAPTVTSILPVSGNRGWPVSITNLGGSNFLSGATVKLARTGYSDIIATGVSVVSSTQITCTFDLYGAAAGQWNVIVTNPDAQSGTLTNGFTVNSPVPVLSTRSPTSGNRGWPVSIISLTGTGFQPGAEVRLRRTGYSDVVATGVNVASPTSIDAGTLDLLDVTAGTWYYVVINTDGQESTSTARTFTVNSPAPTIPNTPAFSPNTGARGATVTVTAPGTRLQPGMSVVLTRSSTTITAYNVNVLSPTSVTFTIDIPAGATTGAYTARYTNTDGGTNTRNNRFTVT